MDSHLKELEQHGIKGCSLNNGMFEENDLAAGKYSIIFTNPESLALNEKLAYNGAEQSIPGELVWYCC